MSNSLPYNTNKERNFSQSTAARHPSTTPSYSPTSHFIDLLRGVAWEGRNLSRRRGRRKRSSSSGKRTNGSWSKYSRWIFNIFYLLGNLLRTLQIYYGSTFHFNLLQTGSRVLLRRQHIVDGYRINLSCRGMEQIRRHTHFAHTIHAQQMHPSCHL